GRAAHIVLLPELLVHHLTGEITAELTSAGTTGLLDLERRAWSDELCELVRVHPRCLPPLTPAGTNVGAWCGVPVHLVGGHDTASAVLGGSSPGHAFVSAGTWLLVGREQPVPAPPESGWRAGLSNEQALPAGIRLLRNVAGWWLVD